MEWVKISVHDSSTWPPKKSELINRILFIGTDNVVIHPYRIISVWPIGENVIAHVTMRAGAHDTEAIPVVWWKYHTMPTESD